MVMWYWSVAILFWQLSIDYIVNGQCKRCGFAKTRLRHPSVPFDSLPYPTHTICRRVRTYVRTLGQSRDNQKKRGWPYSMSMGWRSVLRALRARGSPAIITIYLKSKLCTLQNNALQRRNSQIWVNFSLPRSGFLGCHAQLTKLMSKLQPQKGHWH